MGTASDALIQHPGRHLVKTASGAADANMGQVDADGLG